MGYFFIYKQNLLSEVRYVNVAKVKEKGRCQARGKHNMKYNIDYYYQHHILMIFTFNSFLF